MFAYTKDLSVRKVLSSIRPRMGVFQSSLNVTQATWSMNRRRHVFRNQDHNFLFLSCLPQFWFASLSLVAIWRIRSLRRSKQTWLRALARLSLSCTWSWRATPTNLTRFWSSFLPWSVLRASLRLIFSSWPTTGNRSLWKIQSLRSGSTSSQRLGSGFLWSPFLSTLSLESCFTVAFTASNQLWQGLKDTHSFTTCLDCQLTSASSSAIVSSSSQMRWLSGAWVGATSFLY